VVIPAGLFKVISRTIENRGNKSFNEMTFEIRSWVNMYHEELVPYTGLVDVRYLESIASSMANPRAEQQL